MHIYKIKLC